MKKVTLLSSLFMFCLFISCSSDDDGNNNNEESLDSIVGLWGLTHESNDSNLDNLYEVSECVQNTTYEFKTDNTAVFIEYYLFNGDTCTPSDTHNVTWENIGNNAYRFVSVDDGNDSEVGEVIFEGNTMTIIYSDDYIEVYSKM